MKENILEILENQNKSLDIMEINNLLGLKEIEEYKQLQTEIDDLVSLGKVHKSKKDKYILMDNCSSLKAGIIHINKKGNGFVTVEGFNDDIFVAQKNLNYAVNGDTVEVDIGSNGEGIVTRVLKRDLSLVVGEIVKKHKKLAFILEDKKKDINIELTKESFNHLVEGHKVLVRVIKELKKNNYLGKVEKILGHKNDPGVDIITIAAEHDIFLEFSNETNEELKNMPTEVTAEEIKDRRDLRNEVIFTIDGDDTKDIDDAISIDKDKDNYILGVHIADVSYYVKEGTSLFDDAFNKGTSSYLADTVLPMLPHELSNGICSLNEGEDRLAISCQMVINPKGKVIDHDIFLSVINSKKKMTYNNVNKVIGDGFIPAGYEEFADKLNLMKELADILRKEKVSRGYIDFGLDEAKIVQDENGTAIDVVKRERYDGEKLIEDFMICANETVATHVFNMDLPFIYRVHDVPRPEKITDFLNLVKVMGYTLNVNISEIYPRTMQDILKSLEDKKEFAILSDMLLRSMKKAIYSTDNIGHFGIASKTYTHFTSPIRRFPDLIVHTLLHKYLFENKIDNETISYYQNLLPSYAEQASERELSAIEAEREVLEMKMAEYMESHIGTTYPGIISGVAGFGIFVRLENLIEGLVHISSLNGFYTYVPERLSLVSGNNNCYTIGDEVLVKVVGASKESHTIDFEIVVSEDGDKK